MAEEKEIPKLPKEEPIKTRELYKFAYSSEEKEEKDD